jgi:LPXTG-motif cell wall-anchored protein
MKNLKRVFLVSTVAVGLLWMFGGTTAEAGDTIISTPSETITRTDPGMVTVLATASVAEDLIGRDCSVTVNGSNGKSQHNGNNLIVSTGSDQGVLYDFEAVAFATTRATFDLELSDTVALKLEMGPDGVSSAGGLSVVIDCPPEETTTTSTTIPEDTTTTTLIECVPTGTPVRDVNTGKVYWYQVPGELYVDSCGNEIPEICVKWPDGSYSYLWGLEDCTPVTTTVPPTTTVQTTAVPTTSITPQLPETGSTETLVMVIVASLLTLIGGVTVWAVRR